MITVEACAYMIAEGIAERFAKANPEAAAEASAITLGPTSTTSHTHTCASGCARTLETVTAAVAK
jgi:hypothetical protein